MGVDSNGTIRSRLILNTYGNPEITKVNLGVRDRSRDTCIWS